MILNKNPQGLLVGNGVGEGVKGSLSLCIPLFMGDTEGLLFHFRCAGCGEPVSR